MRNALTSLACMFVLVVTGWLSPHSAMAGPYTKLQVILPGESPAPGTGTGKSGAPASQTVGVPFSVTIRACDSSWNLVTSITNSVSLTSSDGSATLPASFSLSGGTAVVTATLNSAGSFTFTADDGSDPTIPVATSSSVASLLLQGFEFSRITQKNQYAGQAMPITLTAVDPAGNPVSYSGPVSLNEVTSYGDGRISPATVTLSGGSWSGSVTMFRADETSINRGNVNIVAYLAADPSINGTSDPFTVHPGAFTRVQMIVPGQDPAPGSVSGLIGSPASQSAGVGFAVDVYATDAYWNPVVSADNVRITSSDGAATPVTGTLTNGFRRFTFSLNTVGTQTLTVSDLTSGSKQGMTSAGIPVMASGADHFEFNTISGPVTAGQAVTVTVRATDPSGNTVNGYSGNAILIANTGPASISPEAIVFNNGTWTGSMTFRGAGGSVSVTCSDFSSPPHTGTSNSFVVNPGPMARLQVLLPGQTPAGGTATGVSGTPGDQQAGTAFNAIIRAVDQYWNRVPGINDAVDLSSTDEFAGMPAQIALVNGEKIQPVTLYRAGYQRITATHATNGAILPHTSSQVLVNGGPYSRIVLLCPGETIAPGTAEGRSGAATDQSINYAFNATIYATDQWYNPVGGATDVIHITSGDPLAQLPADQAMVDGVAQMPIRLSTGGFQQITASNVSKPSMPTSTTQVRAISSGFHLEAEVTPLNVQAGEQFTLTVKVTNDAGSVIQEINSFVTVEVQNASTQNAGRGTLLNTQFQLLQGQRAMAETYTFAEPIVLIISDDAGNAPAASEVITVSPGAPSEIKLSSDPRWVGGNKHATVRARVVDAFDNGVPARPMVFSLSSGDGDLTPVDSLTQDDGVARCDFHSAREPQMSRVRATSGPLTADIDIETAFVDPNAAGGYLSNYPNPFHPGETPTTIAYKLADNANVTMRIFTLTGGLVFEKTFTSGQEGGLAGLNEFAWDGRNGDGDIVATGGYILQVQANGNGETLHSMRRKIAVVR
ncbi:MAG TPA: FlgD immunoglobulin-like domain containing protein [Candidatus Krumholzibacteria bacterium]|nr:FlgD immunoglobulin-like domain containing protein [Candidatus Krumholzibacteria bacterium]